MEIGSALRALSALSQARRLAAFRLLVRAGPSGLAASTIAERLGTQAATTSFHLAQLTRAGLLTARREDGHVVYVVRLDTLGRLIDCLTEDLCLGVPEIVRAEQRAPAASRVAAGR